MNQVHLLKNHLEKKQKTSVSKDELPLLKKLIKELSTSDSVLCTTIDTQPTVTDPRNLTELYDAIVVAEDLK